MLGGVVLFFCFLGGEVFLLHGRVNNYWRYWFGDVRVNDGLSDGKHEINGNDGSR